MAEAPLAAVWPAPQPPSAPAALHEALRQRIDARLAALLPHDNDALAAAMRHAALGPGQRLRPLLTLLAAHELGLADDDAAALDAGCAIEMVHAASLALDDLPAMDDAAMRRGRRATHVEHGQDMAILAAVALLARAFTLVAALPGVDAACRARLAARLGEAVSLLAHGQVMDLHGPLGEQALAHCSHAKTGVLFQCAVEMAALIAGCAPGDERAQRLLHCALQLGHAYQIHDDLRDAPTDRDRTSHVALLGADAARRSLQRRVDAALAQLPRHDGPFGRFVGALFHG